MKLDNMILTEDDKALVYNIRRIVHLSHPKNTLFGQIIILQQGFDYRVEKRDGVIQINLCPTEENTEKL